MANLLPVGGIIDKYIWDKDGNIICLGQYSINDNTICPLGPPDMPEGTVYDTYLRYLKDDISPKVYPITTKSCIMGGVGRGSTREVIDLSSFITNGYDGSINLINIGDHIKYYTIKIRKLSGVFTAGENVLSGSLPMQYRPAYPLVLKGYLGKNIDGGNNSTIADTFNKYVPYIAINGVLRLIINPRYEVNYNSENNSVESRPLIGTNLLTAFAVYVE